MAENLLVISMTIMSIHHGFKTWYVGLAKRSSKLYLNPKYSKNLCFISPLKESDDYRLSYKLGNLQRLSIYGWISRYHPAGPNRPGTELSFCPNPIFYGPYAKSALVNARLINHCNPSCCKNLQGDDMDFYQYYGKLNKKTQKFKPGSKSVFKFGTQRLSLSTSRTIKHRTFEKVFFRPLFPPSQGWDNHASRMQHPQLARFTTP